MCSPDAPDTPTLPPHPFVSSLFLFSYYLLSPAVLPVGMWTVLLTCLVLVKSQLQCVYGCSGHVTAQRQHFTVLLPILWLLHSFCPSSVVSLSLRSGELIEMSH